LATAVWVAAAEPGWDKEWAAAWEVVWDKEEEAARAAEEVGGEAGVAVDSRLLPALIHL